ncbi:MAG TPA: bifunctional diaminohydroxyphosphoribosylaminopyrimidine deaminase/5-amino-6-(5-phosphoribosylamino)uracil reductase RibD [Aquabacterium sp.]|nr:bifunctional diaminohydroxyphosphoribosylaminopyrimidine deaminase/5-amino-6-(5-phosphoribosylamino)uracil reductase RibD [Aquabacterium sp.]
MEPQLDAFDQQAMALALDWGRKAQWLCPPNPAVGCTLWRDGRLIGAGHTQETGGPHAEVMAMRDARQRGELLAGATAYVTLEPCSHFGRTPPCANGLIDAGISRVVVALLDPNPLVAGQGVSRLRAAGIDVLVLPREHDLAQQAWIDNIGFFSRMIRQRPWVRMKMAGSVDGRTALENGDSQWITGEAARLDGRRWRARAGAVLTGIGTVLDDNPRLDVRGVGAHREPLRAVLDSRWRIPRDAHLLQPPGQVLVYGAAPAPGDLPHAQEVVAPSLVPAGLDLAWVLSDLAQRGVNELHIEAGATLNAALMEQDLVDEFLLYLAPKFLGPGRPLAALSSLSKVADAKSLQFVEVLQIGDDLRVRLRASGRELF